MLRTTAIIHTSHPTHTVSSSCRTRPTQSLIQSLPHHQPHHPLLLLANLRYTLLLLPHAIFYRDNISNAKCVVSLQVCEAPQPISLDSAIQVMLVTAESHMLQSTGSLTSLSISAQARDQAQAEMSMFRRSEYRMQCVSSYLLALPLPCTTCSHRQCLAQPVATATALHNL